MLKGILLITATLICKVAEAIDTGNGATFDLSYQTDKKLLKFNAALPPNTWLGLGFGSGMV